MNKQRMIPPRGYAALRAQYPKTILFFQCGESLEAFDDDAQRVSEITGVKVSRVQDHDVCAFRRERLEVYLKELVKLHRVAVARPLGKAEAEQFRAEHGLTSNDIGGRTEYQLALF